MSFVSLQESLRKELRKRIEAGELTGMELARRTGFTQAHISNFLNRKWGLKLSALDRMLKAVGLTVYDLLNPHELVRYAAVPTGVTEDSVEVPLVDGAAAAAAEVIVNDQVRERIRLRWGVLDRLRPDLADLSRKSWTRFVFIRLEGKDADAARPRLAPGSLLLLDRHYTTLRPYQRDTRNLYAVRRGTTCLVRYVELNGTLLVLRPHNAQAPIEVVALGEGESAASYLVGRIARADLEL